MKAQPWVWAVIAVFAICAFCIGCSAPCWYKGKAISRQNAEDMKAVGMDVQCPQ